MEAKVILFFEFIDILSPHPRPFSQKGEGRCEHDVVAPRLNSNTLIREVCHCPCKVDLGSGRYPDKSGF